MESDAEVDHLQKKIEGICFNLLIQQQSLYEGLWLQVAAELKD